MSTAKQSQNGENEVGNIMTHQHKLVLTSLINNINSNIYFEYKITPISKIIALCSFSYEPILKAIICIFTLG